MIALMGLAALAGPSLEGKPKVVFHAEGSPGFLTFEGTTRRLELASDDTTLTFTVPMDTVQTGIALRDEHMRDKYVQTATYPNVVLTLPRADVAWPAAGQRTEIELQGTFEAHGVEKTVPVTAQLRERKGLVEVRASFPFDTTEHGIAIPSYLGVTIKPEMRAEVQLTVEPG